MKKQFKNLSMLIGFSIFTMLTVVSVAQDDQIADDTIGGSSSCYNQLNKNTSYESLACTGSGGTCQWKDGRGTVKQNCP